MSKVPEACKMPRKKYSPQKLEQAMISVRNDEMTIYKASKVHNVPYQTLWDNLKKIHPPRQQTVLTKEEEELIVDWIHHMAEIGFPITKAQLIHSVGKLVKELNRPNKFTDGIPGRHWYEGFIKRNPHVSSRVCQTLTTARIGATEVKIRQWFNRVYKYLEDNDCLDILLEPSRIFNCDESAFFLCPKGQAVLARKGQKSVYSRSGNDEKENLTLCLGASAEGKLMPILALFPYKRIPFNILQKYPKTWVIGKSDNGWMTCETFYEYIANAFNDFLLKENIKKPVLLFLDGHVSHLSLPLTTFCKENGIILVALLPNSTHALQPMDVAVFHALKNSWKKSVHDWRMANNAQKLKREDFGPVLERCVQSTLTPEIFRKGFQRTGLFPFDQNAINYDKLLKSSHSSSAQSTTDSCSAGGISCGDEYSNAPNHASSYLVNPAQTVADVENFISVEKLKLFENCDGVWQGEAKDESLFYFWKNAKCQVSGFENDEIKIGDATLEANDCGLKNIEDNIDLDWINNNISEAIVYKDESVALPPSLPDSDTGSSKKTKIYYDSDLINNNISEAIVYKDESVALPPSLPDSDTASLKKTEIHNSPPPSNLKKSQFPTPFKKTLLWPETDITGKAKQRIRKSLIPTVATSTEYINHQLRLEEEKKIKLEKVELRKKERAERANAKLNENKNTKPKKSTNKKSKLKTKKMRSSKAIQSSESGCITEEIQENRISVHENSFEIGEYVVVTYEGENFPGLITKVFEGSSKTYDIKTMIMSGLDTISGRVNWRWPEKDDILTYNSTDIIKRINNPILINKRGIYSVVDI